MRESMARESIESLKLRLPVPWRLVARCSVGGCREVGWGPASELLLAVSANGRGVFDGRTGERVARDYDDTYRWLDEDGLVAEGIGPLEHTFVPVAGLSGGALVSETADGWRVVLRESGDDREVVLVSAAGAETLVTREWDTGAELRAQGFSPSGNCLAVASSANVLLLTR